MLTNDHPSLERCWHPIARVGDTDSVVGAELFGRRYVVSFAGGDVLVAPDACPHRGVRLSTGTVVDGCLRCPYHGWRFRPTGECASIPAIGASPIPSRADLSRVPHREAFGLVWIRGDHGDDGFEPLDVPEWDASLDPTSDVVAAWMPDVVVHCSAGQFVDNFLDIAHFPVVHAGTFGADEAADVGELAVESAAADLGPGTIRLRHEHEIANREDPLVDSGEHPLLQPRTMEYTCRVPFTARLRIELPMTGVENTILVAASPTAVDRTTLFTVLLRNDLGDDPDAARHAVDYEMTVLAEDLAVLEQLADPGLPLDLPAQVHTRADRFTVAYRQALSDHLGQLRSARPAPLGTASSARHGRFAPG